MVDPNTMTNNMHDQYRVVRTHEPQPPSGDEYISRLAIRKFYLDGVFRDILHSVDLDGLRMALTDMLASLDKPILDSLE